MIGNDAIFININVNAIKKKLLNIDLFIKTYMNI